MFRKKKSKFALYLEVKKQQRNCRRYLKAMVQEAKEQRELFEECAAEMA